MRITDYEPHHAQAWRTLNTEWIRRLFALEPHDHEQLDDPDTHILAPGGRIFIAEEETGATVGCVALVAMEDGGFELAKMTVADAARGSGLGRRLLEHAVAAAQAAGAPRVYLETNSAAQAAVTLYRSAGFVDIPPQPSPYARCNVWMERRFGSPGS